MIGLHSSRIGWLGVVALCVASVMASSPNGAICPVDSRVSDPCHDDCQLWFVDVGTSCIQTPGGCCPRICKPYWCRVPDTDPVQICLNLPPGGNVSTWTTPNTLADSTRACSYDWQDCGGDNLNVTCQ
jgi:hypothetical protein